MRECSNLSDAEVAREIAELDQPLCFLDDWQRERRCTLRAEAERRGIPLPPLIAASTMG